MITGIAAVVVALAVLAAVLLARSLHGSATPRLAPPSRPASDAHNGTAAGHHQRPRPGTSSPSATPGTSSRWFSGYWVGTASQPSGSVTNWTMELSLPATGQTGVFVLPTLDCSGLLLVTGSGPDTVNVREVVVKNADHLCTPGANITLTRTGSQGMDMAWQDAYNAGNTASGTLTRTIP
jgi:hypothetical protein